MLSLERPSVREAAEAAEMQHPKKDLAGHASFCLKDHEVQTPARSRDRAPTNGRPSLQINSGDKEMTPQRPPGENSASRRRRRASWKAKCGRIFER